MFVLHLKKKRFIICIAAVLLVITAVIFFANADLTPVADFTEINSESYSLKAKNNAERLSFFRQAGINATNETADDVFIPQNFNSVYNEYNELQKKCGFDLSKYAGKAVKRYTYSIDNGKAAVILVYKNRVIGGHIASGIYGEGYLPLF